ncbi:MAG TPA: hypothetical protein PKW52_16030 [Nitrospira sp.]|nr:hypothetical protein [Nitrospira sp.]
MNDSLRYPIAVSVAMGKNRRIRLPKFLSIPVPYVLIEDTRAEQHWLGLCALDALERLMAECANLRLVAEYRTSRPTLPKAVCDGNALHDSGGIWLVAMGSWVEIWSGSVWQTEIPCLA